MILFYFYEYLIFKLFEFYTFMYIRLFNVFLEQICSWYAICDILHRKEKTYIMKEHKIKNKNADT